MPDSPTLFDTLPVTERLGADARPGGTEARPGYRLTERIGWIPNDWRAERLGVVVGQIRSGTSVSGDGRPRQGGEAAVLKTSAVTSGTYRSREAKVVSAVDAARLKVSVRSGDILLNRASGSLEMVGICAVVDHSDEALFLPDKLWRIIPDKSNVASEWLFVTLASPRVRTGIELFASGNSTGIKNITQSDFLSIEVPVPPLPEQREIARVLGAWDRALADAEALLDAKRRQAKGLAQRLLTGRDRLPAFANSPWHKVPLTDLTRESRRRNDGSLGQDRLYGVTKAAGMIPNQDRINVADVSRYKVVRPDAFAYNPMRLNIGSIARLREASPVLASPDYVVFECLADTLDPGFLDHLRRGHVWKRFMEVAGAGSVRVRIYYAHLRLLKVHVPESVEEQRQIAAVLDAAEAEVAALRDWRDALAAQKKGLMERLLTGEVRVTPPTVPA